MIDRETIYCVKCLTNKAETWTGHVLDGDEQILAGWCRKCRDRSEGFCGHFKQEMGAKADD